MQNKKLYFEQLYEMYVKQIFRFVYFRTNNTQRAEDLTAETFLKLWKKIERGTLIDNERALLYIIARGLVIDFYRSKKHTREISLGAVHEDNLASDDGMIEKVYIQSQVAEIYTKLTVLKKEYQEIILLRFIEDLEYTEIAVVLGKKENTIRVLAHRAIEALKKIV